MSIELSATLRIAAPLPPRPAAPDPKITHRHLAKQALIYVRQSSPGQIQRHPERPRRQYALAERAQRLGWPAEQITIIDEDQGKSEAGAPRGSAPPTSATALPSWSRP